MTFDEETGTFLIEPNAALTSFTYTVRMANGTLSTATVTLDRPELSQTELLRNASFESPDVPDGTPWGFVTDEVSFGWTNNSGAPLELVNSGYLDVTSQDGHQWLDSQLSPGGIDLSQEVDVAEGDWAQLSVTVAEQQNIGGDVALEVYWNGVLLDIITQGETGSAGEFETFTYDVKGAAGADAATLVGVGGGNVGYAIDKVSLLAYPDC